MPRPQPPLAAQAPLLPFALLLMAGIAAQALTGTWVCAIVCAALSLTAFGALIFARRVYPALSALALGIGAALAWCEMPGELPAEIGQLPPEALYSGEVSETAPSARGIRAVVRIDSVAVSGNASESVAVRPFRARLGISGLTSEITAGCRLTFRAALAPPPDRRSHPLETDVNRRERLCGIAVAGFVDADSIRSVGAPRGLMPSLRSLADRTNRLIAFSDTEPETQALLSAMLTGHRDWLTPSMRELYSAAGVAHILALSGMHVAILVFICGMAMLPLTLAGHRKAAMAATVCALWLFAIATGASVSVVRAAIMASLILLALMTDRRPAPLNALCVAVVAILAVDPLQLFTASFQLSFAAVLSILMLYPALSAMLPQRPLLRAPLEYGAVSVAAVAGTGIICAWHFGVFNPWFLLSNLAASFLLPWFMGSGIALLCLDAAGMSSGLLSGATDLLADGIGWSARLASSLPGSTMKLTGVDWTDVALYAAVLVLLFAAARAARRKLALLAAAGIVAVFGIAFHTITSTPPAEAQTLFAERSEPHFTLVNSGPGRLTILTAAPERLHAEMAERISERHTALMAICSADSATTVRLKHGQTIKFGVRRILYIERPPEGNISRADYLAIGSRFKGDISELAARRPAVADTVVLSPGLIPSRAAAIGRRFARAGIPVVNLLSRPLGIAPAGK